MNPFRLPSLPIPQHNTREMLDDAGLSRKETARSLRDVARINGFMGATRPLYETVVSAIRGAGLHSATVLDVGCGNGDFARRIVGFGAGSGVAIRVMALDISCLHLSIAREMTPAGAPIEYIEADAFALPFPDAGVDFITSTLFVHHFRADALRTLFGECSRVARVGWAMNDCARDGMALAAFRVLRPYLARSFATRHDALASIRRSYTPDELAAIVASIPGASVRSSFPYRLQIQWTPPHPTTSTSPSSAPV